MKRLYIEQNQRSLLMELDTLTNFQCLELDDVPLLMLWTWCVWVRKPWAVKVVLGFLIWHKPGDPLAENLNLAYEKISQEVERLAS